MFKCCSSHTRTDIEHTPHFLNLQQYTPALLTMRGIILNEICSKQFKRKFNSATTLKKYTYYLLCIFICIFIILTKYSGK